MLADLKKALAECHLQKADFVTKSLLETDVSYLLQRAKEEQSKEQTPETLKLTIQLLNLARHKMKEEIEVQQIADAAEANRILQERERF